MSIAAGREGAAEVVKALLDNGADMTVANILGAAARSGDIAVVKLLQAAIRRAGFHFPADN